MPNYIGTPELICLGVIGLVIIAAVIVFGLRYFKKWWKS